MKLVEAAPEIGELRVVPLECHGEGIGGAISVLSNDEVCFTLARRVFVIFIFAVEQDDDVGEVGRRLPCRLETR